MDCRMEIQCGSGMPIEIASGLIHNANDSMYARVRESNNMDYIDKQFDIMLTDLEEIGKHLLDYVVASRRRLGIDK